ncbi:S1/P1 nuclease [Cyathus striatus]|nr:S1/P1 nuclease [Cyathus striatus]
MRYIHIAAAAVAASASLPSVFAWGAAGHEIVATIAQMYLDPTVLPTICNILNYTDPDPTQPQCHLAPVSTWADKNRFRMRWSAALHYVGALGDHPSETCLYPGERGWAGKQGINVLGGIRNVTNILEDWTLGTQSDEAANEALKFVIHFLGDMHQPLHLTGRDRGGNGVAVAFDGRQTNLHSLWDGLLIAKAVRTTPKKYERPSRYPTLEAALRGTIYDSYIRRIMLEGVLNEWSDEVESWLKCPSVQVRPSSGTGAWQQVLSFFRVPEVASETDDETLCPYHWSQPLHKLNCEIVWPKAIDEPPYSHARLDGYDHHDHEHYATAEEEIAQLDHAAGKRPPHPPLLELDTPEYAGKIAKDKLVEKLLAQGGIRLAGLLNWLFAQDGEGLRINTL